MIGTLNNLGTFAMETVEGIGAQRIQLLCFNLSKCMVTLIEGIEAVTAERDSGNDATEEYLPPVLPHELVKLHVANIQYSKVVHIKGFLSLDLRFFGPQYSDFFSHYSDSF